MRTTRLLAAAALAAVSFAVATPAHAATARPCDEGVGVQGSFGDTSGDVHYFEFCID